MLKNEEDKKRAKRFFLYLSSKLLLSGADVCLAPDINWRHNNTAYKSNDDERKL